MGIIVISGLVYVVYYVSGLLCPALSVVQQAAAVRTHSDLQVGEYTDFEETSSKTDKQWSQEIIENQVGQWILQPCEHG